jgi:hypothetical protein
LRYSVLLGAGKTLWSGPYAQGGAIAPAIVAGALERQLTRIFAVRTELGAGLSTADLLESAAFESETNLTFNRLYLTAFLRGYIPVHAARSRIFAELGVTGWLRTACDVDWVDGSSFFGGETVDCDEWTPSDSDGNARLRPNASGQNVILGIGGYVGRVGGAFVMKWRVPGFATDEGSIHARPLTRLPRIFNPSR